jgi:hypothetical protein
MMTSIADKRLSELARMIPEWKRDSALAQRETAEIRQFLLWNGWSQEEVDTITNPLVIRDRRDLMLQLRAITAGLSRHSE